MKQRAFEVSAAVTINGTVRGTRTGLEKRVRSAMGQVLKPLGLTWSMRFNARLATQEEVAQDERKTVAAGKGQGQAHRT